ncbi:MAG: ferrous iron transport protein B [Acidobacteriota bacterium]|nr:ferrous iron transport protein B [Acidobacteriota bacterium]MDE3266098.1 ferrous iron transport protein B [Acidobacteriota bacterium]
MTQPALAHDCANCPAHHLGNLVRLGVDMSNWDYVVALAGNPNTGKSTVFNALTGLRQHTGNWPGKTVTRAEGGFEYGGDRYKLVDLPGTYSLLSSSLDEETARDFILFGRPDVTVIVVDATRLERNLNLALQVLEITDRAVVCLNLMDEARRKGLTVDARRLARDLGVPVVATAARSGEGLEELNRVVAEVATGSYRCRPRRVGGRSPVLSEATRRLSGAIQDAFPALPNPQWVALRLLDGDRTLAAAVESGSLAELVDLGVREDGDGTAAPTVAEPEATRAAAAELAEPRISAEPVARAAVLELAGQLRWRVGRNFHQALTETVYAEAARIADRAVSRDGERRRFDFDATLDRLVTSRVFGFPLMLLMLTVVFWLTIAGANVPSSMLATLLIDTVHPLLKQVASAFGLVWWLDGLLIDGVYLATAWVVAVMLPPMAIFFPLFTLLEDFGYLPRVAFNLDRMFHRVGAHGKQALTMAMGWGCNAAAVVSTRIIDSPRERLIAIITNNFSLCNGRWPTQILIASIFIGGLVPAHLAGAVSALSVVGVAVLGVLLTFAVSWFLSRTVLRGEASAFSLELPPYRPPRVLQTIYTSIIDRTLIVLWRAVVFAAPAGALIWLLGNIRAGDASLAETLIGALDPFGYVLGLSGIILVAYIIAVPANEIVIPTILMLTVLVAGIPGVGAGAGVMFELDSEVATAQVLEAGGFSLLTAVCLMLFSLVHNPCSTTLYTIWKETRSVRWTAVSALLPIAMGFLLCFAVAQIWRALT